MMWKIPDFFFFLLNPSLSFYQEQVCPVSPVVHEANLGQPDLVVQVVLLDADMIPYPVTVQCNENSISAPGSCLPGYGIITWKLTPRGRLQAYSTLKRKQNYHDTGL